MRVRPLTRREILENCIVRGLLVASIPLSQSKLLAFWQQGEARPPKLTPENEMGPFFKKGAPEAAMLRVPGDAGFPLRVSGKILDARGEPIEGARAEVWQADHHGLYDLKGYRYRARLAPSAKGAYAFETVMPGHYPDRVCQHIHFMVTAPGHKTLVTQLYFATDSVFAGDPDKNYMRDPLIENRELVRPVTLVEQADSAHADVVFELSLQKA
jgi:protocatechuate 3,4-dioxygenase beta subunit